MLLVTEYPFLEEEKIMAICSSGTLVSFFHNHVFLISLYLLLSSVSAADNITAYQSIKEGQTPTSPNGIFLLGFFNPTNGSNSRYLGIWHDDPNYMSTVWMANRESPISDSFGTFTFSNDGNLVLLDGTNRAVWTTNASGVSNETHAQLLDSGNLILREGTSPGSGRIVWESFSNPSSALLLGMKIGINLQTKQTQVLRSWTSVDDPAPGIFSFGADPQKPDQFFIWRRSVPYWRSLYWNGSAAKVVPYLSQPVEKLLNLSIVKGKEEVYFTYSIYNDKSNMFKNLMLDPFGRLEYVEEHNSGSTSSMYISGREEQCSGPASCGANTICNDNNKPLCRCLSGFDPLAPNDWNTRMDRFGLGGCIRSRRLQCDDQGKFDLLRMKFPDPNPSYVVRSTEACREVCLRNCACNAYTYYDNKPNSGNCAIWEGEIKQLLESVEEDELSDIYLRVAPSAPDKKRKWLIPVVIVTVITGSIMSVIFIFMFRRRAMRRAKNLRKLRLVEDGNEDVDIPYFELANIVAATNDFSDSNKLGQGGFGPVYKGKFPGGQEIAVKRLSKSSGQGFEEFKNEVILIAKLQHRNLVRLLGYCFDGDEKMLLYEYMPNKSLDFFIFDKNRSKLMDWRKRFTVILGIARGLLYLHQDSRLRIIHRDLKTSNVLLDEEMNPKISDFGLARIFGGNQTEENTNRVVGTYGYMSPEYASHGLFSVKSDVFSFGVILVEIITGQKNTSFFQFEGSFTLLGHAWQLWEEDKALDLIDPSIREICDTQEVLKCLHIGLLCVQEDAGERPDMATVVAFFVNQTTTLPTPNKPAFFIKSHSNEDYNQNSASVCSKNEVTISSIVGR